MARHRPAAEGGYQCGEDTRVRIIDAALRVFGEKGYDGASTREIAREAGVNPPALQYYFDGKEGVYLACIEQFIALVWEQLSGVVTEVEAATANPDVDDAALIDAYLAIQARFASFVGDPPGKDVKHWRMFMARERAGLGPAAAFELIDSGLNRRLSAATCGIVGRLLGKPADDMETRVRTIAIDGQALVFQTMQRRVLRSLGWDQIGVEETAQISAVILQHTRELLEALVRAREARSVA